MPKAKNIVVPHRRRRELKTDYRHRLELLKSGKHRLVVRKSLNGVVCQVVEYKEKGDRCLVYADMLDLKKFGWKTNTGNIPAAYLTGLICGVRAKKHKIGKAVLDIGLAKSTAGGRIYAALKGALDGGLDVAHSDEILPKDDRLKGGHIASYAEWLKRENSAEYKRRFSGYIESKTTPDLIAKQFDEVKANILNSK